jgi:hypothetical protein
MSRLLLQICTGLLALIPIATGIISMQGVKDPLYRPLGLPAEPVLDSNLRFFGGVWLGIGLALLWLVPSVDRTAGDALSGSVGGSIPWRGRSGTLVAPDRVPAEALRGLPRATVHLLAIPGCPVRRHTVIGGPHAAHSD